MQKELYSTENAIIFKEATHIWILFEGTILSSKQSSVDCYVWGFPSSIFLCQMHLACTAWINSLDKMTFLLHCLGSMDLFRDILTSKESLKIIDWIEYTIDSNKAAQFWLLLEQFNLSFKWQSINFGFLY